MGLSLCSGKVSQKTLNATCDLFSLEIMQYTKNNYYYSVCYGNEYYFGRCLNQQRYKSGKRGSLNAAKSAALSAINELLKPYIGVTFEFSDFIMAYMFEDMPGYKNIKNDCVVCPIRLVGDTIIDIYGKTVAVIVDNQLTILSNDDGMKKALNYGFNHSYGSSYNYLQKRGSEYAARRLVWLAGEKLKEQILKNDTFCLCYLLKNGTLELID